MVEDIAGREAHDRSRLFSTIRAFLPYPDQIHTITPLGDGNINATYLVTFTRRPSLVVQRLNGAVFPDPVSVVRNVALVTSYLGERRSAGAGRCHCYRFPEAVELRDGRSWYEDQSGSVWRCLSYLDNTVSRPCVTGADQALEAGRLLGCFHALLEGFDSSALADPLPGFHDLSAYKRAYLNSVADHRRSQTSEFLYCLRMIEARLDTDTLGQCMAPPQVPQRVIHGDPKCDNFLFDRASGQPLSLIDLDTVSHGLLAVDIGDCLRSFCNPAGEKARAEVGFDMQICEGLLEGYFQSFEPNRTERELFYHGVRLLTYELGLRFFTDHLNGDRYFKITRDGENLQRARVQFKLLESIEAQRSAIEKAAGIG